MSEDRLRAAIALYDRFTHEGMERRAFMAELTRIAGGAAAAGLMLSSIAAGAVSVTGQSEDNRRFESAPLDLEVRPGRRLRLYVASPPIATVADPIVIVIHENRGLNDHIRDVTRRFATAGFSAVAPDFLTATGGTPTDEDQARARISALDPTDTVMDGVALIRRYAETGRKVGIVGFCWGGAMVNRLAVAEGDALTAGVSFYGPAPDPAEAARVRAHMLIILAGLDQRVNATARPWIMALNAAGRDVQALEYPNVDHAFHNDTSAARYNREAAEQAWAATLSFFRRHLEGRQPFHG